MKMKIYNQLFVLMAAVMVLGNISCSKEIEYDEDKNKEYWRRVLPVDSIDQDHAWQLSTSQLYQFTVNANVEANRLEIYSANPITSTEAEMMGRVYVSDEQQVTMSVSVPSMLTTLYAALIDRAGTYTVTRFNVTDRHVDFSTPIAIKQKPSQVIPKVMAYTYCYDEGFPGAGDYDYNDLVMRIGLERTGPRQVDIHVTLSAVGASAQMAGAIRLLGFSYQDIASVDPKDGKTLNVNVPKLSYGLMPNDEMLQKGRNGEAVINLFVDAHWAMDDNIETINDDFTRKKYNVSQSLEGLYDMTYAKTVDFTVYFNNGDGLNNFTQESIDPFIVTYYMANKIETHLNEFMDAQTLYNYDVSVLNNIKTLPWALKIPSSYFQYPLDGFKIGFIKHLKSGTVSLDGAYREIGHSFGEWVENRRNGLDWYQYPTDGEVW
jgi:LruC domain-containing protein